MALPVKKTPTLKMRVPRRPTVAAKTIKKTSKLTGTKIDRKVAKSGFLGYCRQVLDEERLFYVADADGVPFMALDFEERHLHGPLVDISVQFFKDNFSRCSSAIRDGVCFRLTLKGRNSGVIARRHTQYKDPLDDVFAQWQEKVVDAALQTKGNSGDVSKAIRKLEVAQNISKEELQQQIKALAKGIARLAIGHRPFDEGEMSPGVMKLYRDPESLN